VRKLVQHDDRVRAVRQDQACSRIGVFIFSAENAAVLPVALFDIGHAPGSPQLLHSSSPISAGSNGLPSTRRRNSLPTLKKGTRLAATETKAPLLGLRPWRA